MRIVIDMQGAMTPASGHRGVGRYTKELVRALIKTKNEDDEIILALCGSFRNEIRALRDSFEPMIGADNIKVWQQFYDTMAVRDDNASRIEIGEVTREAFLNSFNADVIFSTNLQEGFGDSTVTSCKKINSDAVYCTTLHDVTPLMFPKLYLGDNKINKWYYEKLQGVVDSDIVITDSEFSKKQIHELLGIKEENIHVIYIAVDAFDDNKSNLHSEQQIREKYSLPEKFLMYVGGNDEHKNIKRFLKGYSLLPEEIKKDYQIVLIGKEFFQDKIRVDNMLKETETENSVVVLGFVPDDELAAMYSMCEAFVFPSISEGFGIPPLEAIKSGTVAITSNATSLPEVTGVKEATFDPYSVEEISEKIKLILTDESFKNDILEKEIAHSKTFSWESSAKKLWDIWHSNKKIKNNVGKNKSIDFIDCVVDYVKSHSDIKLTEDDLRWLSISMAESDYQHYPKKKTLYLDISATVYEDSKTGIQRVARAISCALYKADDLSTNIDIIYSRPDTMDYFRANDFLKQIDGIHRTDETPIVFYPGDILVTLDLHPGVAKTHVALFEYLMSRGIKIYHSICDILPVTHNFHEENFAREFENDWLASVLKSNGAVCISESVMDEVADYIRTTGNGKRNYHLAWSHLGADIKTSLPTKGLSEDADKVLNIIKMRKTFLMVGTIEPRKGHIQMLRVFNQIWQSNVDCNLVMVGKLGWKMDDFGDTIKNHPEYNKRLFWLRGISDEYLNKVYDASSVLLAASEGEGFGLPLIEAAMKKMPILARDIKVFREIAKDYAAYFPNDDNGIINSIMQWIKLFDNNIHPKSDNMPYLTWKESAYDFYNIVVNGNWKCTLSV